MSDAFRFLFQTGGIYPKKKSQTIEISIIRRFKVLCSSHTHGWKVCMSITGGSNAGSRCRPRNESSRLQIRPLPRNMNPVTSQKTRGSWNIEKCVNKYYLSRFGLGWGTFCPEFTYSWPRPFKIKPHKILQHPKTFTNIHNNQNLLDSCIIFGKRAFWHKVPKISWRT